MSNTDFKKICRKVDKYGFVKIYDDDGEIEIRRNSVGYINSYYSVWRVGKETNCIDCAWSLDKLKYLFVA